MTYQMPATYFTALYNYADDTNLSASLQSIKCINPNETVDTLSNKELSKISKWLSLNKLSLKCETI